MSRPPAPKDEMRYDLMAQDALRGVVKMSLKRAATPQGLPGEHHFYITFKTQAPGVSGPPELLAQYPDEMRIVLQHQYWDLAPGETFFAVTLKFGGQPKRLSVPYAAVTQFYDPHVQFMLQFEVDPTALPPQAEADAEAAAAVAPPAGEASTEEGGEKPKVVSLDQFRKK
jgi:hypothetical protein